MQRMLIETTSREQLVNVTGQLQSLISEMGWSYGLLSVFCPHTTAAVSLNVAHDPTVAKDILAVMEKLVPYSGGYAHLGNADAHIKASLIGASEQLFLENGALLLGEWQKVLLCEFDGPRTRQLWVKLQP